MKVDFHVHSRISEDGKLTMAEIFEILRVRDIGAVAITDHNSVRGSLLAREESKGLDVIVIRGTEISSSKGHIIALGVDEDVPRGLTPEETIERIHDLGGIAVAAHPFRMSTGVGEKIIRRCRFDAVEALNGWVSKRHNRRAHRLSVELNLAVTAGSDGHRAEEIGKAYGLVDECESEEQLIDAILKGKVKPEGESRSASVLVRDAFEMTMDWIKRGFRRL